MSTPSSGIITGISGPVIRAFIHAPVKMFEVAYVGKSKLLGEVIRIQEEYVDIQVYEDTGGVAKGEPVSFDLPPASQFPLSLYPSKNY